GHSGELGAGDGLIAPVGAVIVAHGYAVASQVLHIARVPGIRVNILELHIISAGDALIQLVREQAGKDGRRLAPAHAALRAEGAVCVADNIGPVVLGFRDGGNGEFAVLVGFAALTLAQVALDD